MALAALRSLGSRVRPDVFYRSDFSHPISHRTPHYRVGNGGIRWMVISQKPLNFGMKRHCKIQDNMGGNGLGNRRSATTQEMWPVNAAICRDAPLRFTARPLTALLPISSR